MSEQEFMQAVLREVERARTIFPGANATNCALVEEIGEVSKALMYEPWDALTKEAVQAAAMRCRLVTEGDSTMREFRFVKVHDNGRRYMLPEHVMPTAKEPSK